VADSTPPELIILIVAIVGFFGTGAAMVIYVYAARQGKRRGKRPAAVIQDDLQALKNGPYRRVGAAIQKATSKTAETLSSTLTSVGDKLASAETAQTQPGQKPPFPSPDPRAPPPNLRESTQSTNRPRRALEKPVLGMPGRTLDPLNLADTIDQMVQQRLRERSDLANRRVRLASGLDGGLRIYVDDEVFEAVSDITDFKVRELIRDTIREWEGF
jgi:hypothetical protein